VKCGALNVKLDGILYSGSLRVSQSRILEKSTRIAACQVSRRRGYIRRSNRMSNGRGCRTSHGRWRTNIWRAEKLGLTRKICSNSLSLNRHNLYTVCYKIQSGRGFRCGDLGLNGL